MNALTDMSVAELCAAIKAKKVSPVEVVKAHYERIKAVNDKVNAYVLLTEETRWPRPRRPGRDCARCLRPAAWHSDRPEGPDRNQGRALDRGFKVLANHVPSEDAAVVARWRARHHHARQAQRTIRLRSDHDSSSFGRAQPMGHQMLHRRLERRLGAAVALAWRSVR
jgi:hypothetical protein